MENLPQYKMIYMCPIQLQKFSIGHIKNKNFNKLFMAASFLIVNQ